jgi:hypothetical protein
MKATSSKQSHLFQRSAGLAARLAVISATACLSFGLSTATYAQDKFIDPSSLDQIIGGKVVDASDSIAATTVAIVNQTPDGTALCTGSIVADDLIVTAGHCVGPDKAKMKIAFRRDLRGDGTVLGIKGYVRHKNYGKMQDDQDMYDIALIRIDGALPQGYTAAKLLDSSSSLGDGQSVTLAGYGITIGKPTDADGDAGAGTLRKVDVNIQQALWGQTEVLLDQRHGKGACHGDSGGPAFSNVDGELRLFGITSRGQEGGPDDCAGGAIYTNILAHQAFLKTAAAKLRKLP